MSAPWDFGSINEQLSAAAVDPTRWRHALQHVSEVVGAKGAVLIPTGRPKDLISTESMAEASARYVHEGWHARDLRFRALGQIARDGIAVDLDIVTQGEMGRSEYYNDFLRPHGLRWFAGLGITAGDELWCVSLQRGIAQAPFSRREQRMLLRLRASMGIAATISKELSMAHAQGIVSAFDLLGSPALVLDQFGKVVRTNEACESKLGPELRVVKHRLVANNREASQRIEELVLAVLSVSSEAALRPPIRINRIEARPRLVYAVPLPVRERLFATGRALVIIIDLNSGSKVPENHRAVFSD